MSGLQCLTSENIWFDKHRYDEAERRFYEGVNGPAMPQQQVQLFDFPTFKSMKEKNLHTAASSAAVLEGDTLAKWQITFWRNALKVAFSLWISSMCRNFCCHVWMKKKKKQQVFPLSLQVSLGTKSWIPSNVHVSSPPPSSRHSCSTVTQQTLRLGNAYITSPGSCVHAS